jgi:CTP-dependent riboflavin kinase
VTEIRGRVREGKGEARNFTQLDWVRKQIRDKLGLVPYPGTLNLETTGSAAPAALGAAGATVIEPEPGFCAARCYRVRVNGRVDAVWIVPEVAGYPAHQIELIAGVSLRDTLHLKDGSIVTMELMGAV